MMTWARDCGMIGAQAFPMVRDLVSGNVMASQPVTGTMSL